MKTMMTITLDTIQDSSHLLIRTFPTATLTMIDCFAHLRWNMPTLHLRDGDDYESTHDSPPAI